MHPVEEEFTNNLLSCKRALLSLALNKVRRHEDAEDVVQRASVIMWNKYDLFDNSTNFVKWACNIVALEANNIYRSLVRRPTIQDQELYERLAETCEDESEKTDQDSIAETLGMLDADERELLTLAYLDSARLDEYAEKKGKSKQTIYNKLCLLKKRVRKALEASKES
jgi:RNA polymerase sigma-70 factor (ECF subfamily)